MSSVSFNTSTTTSLIEAISFLTRPLSRTSLNKSTISSLQQILLSTLTTLPTWLRNSRITLTFSSAARPPRSIYAACVATRVDWEEWFYTLFGGREFDLVIERDVVSVRVAGIAGRTVIWQQEQQVPITRRLSFIPPLGARAVNEPEPMVQVPISKFSQSARLNTAPPPYSATTMSHSKTLAQQILQSEHEQGEADEIFAMISNLNPSSLASPTPTRGPFPVHTSETSAPITRPTAPTPATRLSMLEEEEMFHSRLTMFRQPISVIGSPSPVSSPESSCPGSPTSASASSTWSYSHSSSQESLTSISAASSPTYSPSSSPIKPTSKPFVPRSYACVLSRGQGHDIPSSSPLCPTMANMNTNANKVRQVQKYLYQGGQSTTLTGGVMLGAAANKTPASTTRPSAPVSPFKYRPAQGSKPWRRNGVAPRF